MTNKSPIVNLNTAFVRIKSYIKTNYESQSHDRFLEGLKRQLEETAPFWSDPSWSEHSDKYILHNPEWALGVAIDEAIKCTQLRGFIQPISDSLFSDIVLAITSFMIKTDKSVAATEFVQGVYLDQLNIISQRLPYQSLFTKDDIVENIISLGPLTAPNFNRLPGFLADTDSPTKKILECVKTVIFNSTDPQIFELFINEYVLHVTASGKDPDVFINRGVKDSSVVSEYITAQGKKLFAIATLYSELLDEPLSIYVNAGDIGKENDVIVSTTDMTMLTVIALSGFINFNKKECGWDHQHQLILANALIDVLSGLGVDLDDHADVDQKSTSYLEMIFYVACSDEVKAQIELDRFTKNNSMKSNDDNAPRDLLESFTI